MKAFKLSPKSFFSFFVRIESIFHEQLKTRHDPRFTGNATREKNLFKKAFLIEMFVIDA